MKKLFICLALCAGYSPTYAQAPIGPTESDGPHPSAEWLRDAKPIHLKTEATSEAQRQRYDELIARSPRRRRPAPQVAMRQRSKPK
jgi:hypothetical protein